MAAVASGGLAGCSRRAATTSGDFVWSEQACGSALRVSQPSGPASSHGRGVIVAVTNPVRLVRKRVKPIIRAGEPQF